MSQRHICSRCQGNGEIVLDWDAYSAAESTEEIESATAVCPDCDGEGYLDDDGA
jgi:DnaJ-class molecular chaperone